MLSETTAHEFSFDNPLDILLVTHNIMVIVVLLTGAVITTVHFIVTYK